MLATKMFVLAFTPVEENQPSKQHTHVGKKSFFSLPAHSTIEHHQHICFALMYKLNAHKQRDEQQNREREKMIKRVRKFRFEGTYGCETLKVGTICIERVSSLRFRPSDG